MAVLVTIMFSLLWFSIVIDHDGRGGVVTRSVVGPFLGAALLGLVVISSGLRFSKERQHRDLWSLAMSGISFLGVLGEVVSLYFVQLHGPW